MAMGAVTSLMVMMTMASMMIFNLMTKMILIIGNANYDDKDENDDDNLVLQGPDGRGYITQPFSGPSYSPGRSDLPYFVIIMEMIILAMRMNSLKEYF